MGHRKIVLGNGGEAGESRKRGRNETDHKEVSFLTWGSTQLGSKRRGKSEGTYKKRMRKTLYLAHECTREGGSK